MSNDRQQRAARAEQMRKEREKSDRRQRNLITVGIVVVVVALIALAGVAISSSGNETEKDVIQPDNATTDYGIVYDTAAAGGTVKEGAKPVSVELYEDFQCPVCQQFEQQSGELLKQQVAAGAITITFRPWSFLDERGGSTNDYSKRSTSAAICALESGGVGDYVKVHDYLYANQPEESTDGPSNDDLVDAFKGLGITGVESCITSEKYVPWVKKAQQVGEDKGIGRTPTVLVDGKIVDNPTPVNLQAAITAAAKA